MSIPASTMAVKGAAPRFPFMNNASINIRVLNILTAQQIGFKPISALHSNLNNFPYSKSRLSNARSFSLAYSNSSPSCPTTDQTPNATEKTIFEQYPELFQISRDNFPDDFLFGVGTSAFQVEGARHEKYGIGKSIWDTFCETRGYPHYGDGSKHYEKLEDDVNLLKELGVDSYRFSLSWPRIMANGRDVNKQGVEFYNKLIDTLRGKGIEPFVTLFHWEVPQDLETEYKGFLDPKIREDFKNYAKFCFDTFGDRVKYWTTINEPQIFSYFGYTKDGSSFNAPGRDDNPGTEPYIAGHNLLLAHADVYSLYKQEYKDKHKDGGKIGITLNALWYEPQNTGSKQDKDAADRIFDFSVGWFMKPLTQGTYPEEITKCWEGRKCPKDGISLSEKLKPDEIESLKNSFDFIGINYYTALKVTPKEEDKPDPAKISYHNDIGVVATPYGEQSYSDWVYPHGEGLQKLLQKMRDSYGHNIQFYITENGIDKPSREQKHLTFEDCKNDYERMKFHYDHIKHVLRAIKEDDISVNGYLVILDLYYVDHDNDFERRAKDSAHWYKEFLGRKADSTKAEVNKQGVQADSKKA